MESDECVPTGVLTVSAGAIWSLIVTKCPGFMEVLGLFPLKSHITFTYISCNLVGSLLSSDAVAGQCSLLMFSTKMHVYEE